MIIQNVLRKKTIKQKRDKFMVNYFKKIRKKLEGEEQDCLKGLEQNIKLFIFKYQEKKFN